MEELLGPLSEVIAVEPLKVVELCGAGDAGKLFCLFVIAAIAALTT